MTDVMIDTLREQAHNGDPLVAEMVRTHDKYVLTPPSEPNDPWRAFTLADAYMDRPPTQYIGIWRIPSLNILYGPPGAYKSMFLADNAICTASGIPWLSPAPWLKPGRAGFISEQVPVMWLDFDNGADMDHERFEALRKAYDLPGDIPLYYFAMPDPWLNASDKSSIGGLILRVQNYGAKLIIIDNLGTVSGGVDENSGAMIPVMSLLRQLAENTGVAVTVIHHQRKSTGYSGRIGDTLRGHSSIEAAVNLALLVEREEHSDTITIKSTKVRGPDILPFGAIFTYEKKTNGDLLKARFYGTEIEDTSSDAAIDREIITALEGVAINKSDLAAVVKKALVDIGINRIRDKIDRLASAGKINEKGGKKPTERIYSLL